MYARPRMDKVQSFKAAQADEPDKPDALFDDMPFSRQALHDALARLDESVGDSDGQLSLWEFRQLWKFLFPQVQMGTEEFGLTEQLFRDIDEDGSEFVDMEEIAIYLHRRKVETEKRIEPPHSWQDWTWLLVGTGKKEKHLEGCPVVLVQLYRLLSQVVIITSIVILLVESLPELKHGDDEGGSRATFAIETACVSFFTVEFIAYTVSYHSGDWNAYSYFTDQSTWIDIVSVLPYYVGVSAQRDTSGFAAVRITRMLRMLRIIRALRSCSQHNMGGGKMLSAVFTKALRKSWSTLLWFFVLVAIMMSLSATIVYYAERKAALWDDSAKRWYWDPESEYSHRMEAHTPPFQSIPDAMWFTIYTITSGGPPYSPATPGAKVVISLTMLVAIILVSFPINILNLIFLTINADRDKAAKQQRLCDSFYKGIVNWVQSGGLAGQERAVAIRQSRSVLEDLPEADASEASTTQAVTYHSTMYQPDLVGSATDLGARKSSKEGSDHQLLHQTKLKVDQLDEKIDRMQADLDAKLTKLIQLLQPQELCPSNAPFAADKTGRDGVMDTASARSGPGLSISPTVTL